MASGRDKNKSDKIKVDDLSLDDLAGRIEHQIEMTNARLDRMIFLLEKILHENKEDSIEKLIADSYMKILQAVLKAGE